ncbi:MAG: TIGR03936 family radical SAM-associated protein [Bacillota bacterium]
MNLRIKYGKTDLGKFVSHLDLLRAWERAFRRANIPIAFSQGFNPHPRMSFGSALAVGVTSSGEYMDIVLKKETPIKEIKQALEKYLPQGLVIYDIEEISEQAQSLMSIINRAKYVIKVKTLGTVTEEMLDNRIKDMLTQEKIEILRESKKGLKEKDIKEGVFEVKGRVIGEGFVELEVTVQTGSQGNVRPEEILQALEKCGLPLDLSVSQIHRSGLFVGNDMGMVSPLSVKS